MEALKADKKKKFIMDFLILLIAFFIAWITFKFLLPWFMPFIIGFLIAAIVQPYVRFLHQKVRINRKIAGVIAVLLFIILFALLITVGITKLFSELAAVFEMLPSLFSQFSQSIDGISEKLLGYMNRFPIKLSGQFNNSINNLSSEFLKLSSITGSAASFIFETASKVPGLLFDIIITIIAACFISADYPDIRGFVMRQLPHKYQNIVCDIKEFFFMTVARLVRAYLTLMTITFVQLAIGLLIIRVPHAVTIAALIAIVDVLPILGTGTVMIPWVIIELFTGNIRLAICLAALYAFIAIVRHVCEPKIVGYHIGLHPLVTLISMIIGLKAMGIAGMFIFPFIVILVKHLQDAGKIKVWK